MNLITYLINRHLNRNADMQRRRAERQRRAESADPVAHYVNMTLEQWDALQNECDAASAPQSAERDVRESLGIGGRYLLGDMPFSEN